MGNLESTIRQLSAELESQLQEIDPTVNVSTKKPKLSVKHNIVHSDVDSKELMAKLGELYPKGHRKGGYRGSGLFSGGVFTGGYPEVIRALSRMESGLVESFTGGLFTLVFHYLSEDTISILKTTESFDRSGFSVWPSSLRSDLEGTPDWTKFITSEDEEMVGFFAHAHIARPLSGSNTLTERYERLRDGLIEIIGSNGEEANSGLKGGRGLTTIIFGSRCLPTNLDYRTILDEYIFSEVGLIKAALTYLNKF